MTLSRVQSLLLACTLLVSSSLGFAPPRPIVSRVATPSSPRTFPLQASDVDLDVVVPTEVPAPVLDVVAPPVQTMPPVVPDVMPPLQTIIPDLDTVALVAGQENYAFAVVVVGEAIWSFVQAPSLDHAKILIPAIVSALVLVLVSGPMITSGDASQVGLGLGIATAVSIGLGATYLLRMLAPFSPSPKEIAFLGLLVAVAGFFSFSQNLVVDGFVTLPSIPLPSLPQIDLPF